MHRSTLRPAFVIGALATGACSASGPSASTTTPPVPARNVDTIAAGSTRLSLIQGQYKYRFAQNTRIKTDTAAELTTSTISTTARLIVEVVEQPDSNYSISITVDSLQLTAEGQIPARRALAPIALGTVLEASLRNESMSIQVRLPDSLCAYSHFVTVARLLLLPQLPNQITNRAPPKEDSSSVSTCRAGAQINMVTVQQLRETNSSPYQVALREKTQLYGAGMLGRDSISVSGSITGEGVASFSSRSRLPSLVQMQSEGQITVRVGGSITSFRQASTQQIQKEEESAPPPN